MVIAEKDLGDKGIEYVLSRVVWHSLGRDSVVVEVGGGGTGTCRRRPVHGTSSQQQQGSRGWRRRRTMWVVGTVAGVVVLVCRSSIVGFNSEGSILVTTVAPRVLTMATATRVSLVHGRLIRGGFLSVRVVVV